MINSDFVHYVNIYTSTHISWEDPFETPQNIKLNHTIQFSASVKNRLYTHQMTLNDILRGVPDNLNPEHDSHHKLFTVQW